MPFATALYSVAKVFIVKAEWFSVNITPWFGNGFDKQNSKGDKEG